MTVPFTIEHTDPQVVTVRCKAKGEDWAQWFLLRTDAHHDNPHCDQAMEKRHLDEAVRRGAGVIDAGDLFCAMQGKYDKRSDKSCLRPEHQCGDYLDALVRTASEFYAPYAPYWIVMGRGNHESSIKNRHETDLTERTIERIQMLTGTRIPSGGYTGWVRILLERSTRRASVKLWYCHGWGGGGAVTVNMIQAGNRMPAMVDGADVIFTGHVHEAWVNERVRAGLSDMGVPVQRSLHICQGPSYKDEYADGRGGWHIETGKPPKPVGAWWMKLTYSDGVAGVSFERAT